MTAPTDTEDLGTSMLGNPAYASPLKDTKGRLMIGRHGLALAIAAAIVVPYFALAQGADEVDFAISGDGTRIAFDKVGNGPVLIIVGGAASYRALDPTTSTLAELLAPNFSVVTYDRRGRGESTDALPYAPEREIEDIAALVDLAGGRASLVGYSSGAVLALEAAAAGLPIDAVVMYEPPIVLPGGDFPPPPDDVVAVIDQLVAAGDRDEAVAYFMGTVGTPPEEVERMRQGPNWPLLERIAHTMAYDWRILFKAYYAEDRFPEDWSQTTVPVLIVNGDASLPFMPATADAIAAALPGADRLVLPGQGHSPAPEVIAPAIRDFLLP